MIEQIKEYLNSEDSDIVAIGFELLNGIEGLDRRKIILDCGYRRHLGSERWSKTVFRRIPGAVKTIGVSGLINNL